MKMMEEEFNPRKCKYCNSDHVVRYGHTKQGTGQRLLCRDCGHTFMHSDALPHMQTPADQIAAALSMYYEGMSLNSIRRHLQQTTGDYPSDSTVYEWITKFSKIAVSEAKEYKPKKIGDKWIADETYVRVDKTTADVKNPYSKSRKAKWVVFWDIIDADTRFLLASHLTTTRGTKDAKALMEKAAKCAGKTPRVVITDKLAAYLDGIELAFGSETTHKQGAPFEIENNTNLIERFHSTLKSRTKVMRALKNKDTLEKFTDTWLVFYNYLRPHESLKNHTPAEAAGIKYPYKNWLDIVQSPNTLNSMIKPRSRPVAMPKFKRPRKKTPKEPKLGKPHYSRKWGGMTRKVG
jgi:transposase-like protein